MKCLMITAASALMLCPAALSQESQKNKDVDINALRLLHGDELHDAFSGQTRIGTHNPAIPNPKARPLPFTETTHENGRLIYKKGETSLTGDWKASGDRICFKYDSNPYAVHCYRAFQIGNCLYGYSLNNSTIKSPIDPNMWNSRTIIEGDISTCDDVLG